MLKNIFFQLLVLLVFSGCANQPIQYSISDIEKSSSISVRDNRPASEKQRETFSYLVSSDAFAISRVGDGNLSPNIIRILQHRAYEKNSSKQPIADLGVYHLVAYSNEQALARHGAIAFGVGGIVGELVAGPIPTPSKGIRTSLVNSAAFEKELSSEYRRAYYSAEENPGRGSVLVFYIETEINGRRVFTRSVVPILEMTFAQAWDAAIRDHLNQY